MTPENEAFLRDLVRQKSGISLSKDKDYLWNSRLGPLAQRHGFKDIDGLADAVRVTRNAKLLDEVIVVMTTNESFFFRDNTPFDHFRDVMLPRLAEACAARRMSLMPAAVPFRFAMLSRAWRRRRPALPAVRRASCPSWCARNRRWRDP